MRCIVIIVVLVTVTLVIFAWVGSAVIAVTRVAAGSDYGCVPVIVAVAGVARITSVNANADAIATISASITIKSFFFISISPLILSRTLLLYSQLLRMSSNFLNI